MNEAQPKFGKNVHFVDAFDGQSRRLQLAGPFRPRLGASRHLEQTQDGYVYLFGRFHLRPVTFSLDIPGVDSGGWKRRGEGGRRDAFLVCRGRFSSCGYVGGSPTGRRTGQPAVVRFVVAPSLALLLSPLLLRILVHFAMPMKDVPAWALRKIGGNGGWVRGSERGLADVHFRRAEVPSVELFHLGCHGRLVRDFYREFLRALESRERFLARRQTPVHFRPIDRITPVLSPRLGIIRHPVTGSVPPRGPPPRVLSLVSRQ